MFAVRRFEPAAGDAARPGKKRKASTIDASSPLSTIPTPASAPTNSDALPDTAADTITVLSRRKADKLRLRASRTSEADTTAADAEDGDERQRRKDAKREKRRARRDPLPSEETTPVDAQHSHFSAALDLQPLLALKNSTRTRDDSKTAPPPPPTLPASSLPSPSSPKHQRRKDPGVRAAERQARKRARELQLRRDRGETVDEEAEPDLPALPTPPTEEKEAEPDDPQHKQPSTVTPPPPGAPLAGDEAEVRDQRRLAARPNWMARGLHIDPNESLPISSLALHPALLTSLHSAGIASLFPVQSQVIPLILPLRSSHDVCVSSPTGSGKTLIYILPILHALAGRTLPLLRAVVIVPSRGLAQQVWREMAAYAKGVGVRVGLSVGGGSFKKEQLALVRPRHTRRSPLLTPEDLLALEEGVGGWGGGVEAEEEGEEEEMGGGWQSGVEVLVTTPGRLMDHLDGTPGFTLRHLEFLVIDEVDRLLTQHYQDWPQRVWTAMQPLPPGGTGGQWETTAPVTCQKLLLSATLTGHPAKLASLHLRNPVLFIDSQSRQKRYSIPQGLAASFYLCEASEKPLLLLHLLTSLPLVRPSTPSSGPRVQGEQVLVFTSSLDACHRVARLLSLWGGMSCAEYSSVLSQKARDALLAAFRRREVAVLVCSDVMARGMDISGVSVVVNYDVPLYIQTYVHRVGRTARGGGEGRAVTLLKRTEYRHFMTMVRRAANSYMQRELQDKAGMEAMQERYVRVLAALAEVIRKERRGRMGTLDKVAPVGKEGGEAKAMETDEGEGGDAEEGVDQAEWTFKALSRGPASTGLTARKGGTEAEERHPACESSLGQQKSWRMTLCIHFTVSVC